MEIQKIKELISYLVPLQIEACSSSHNPLLEVTLKNGRYILDAQDSNYSFGSLYTIFKSVFKDLNIRHFNFSNCLLLGLGGGSIIHLLQKEHCLLMPITAVEIDPVVINLGMKYFNLNEYNNLEIVNEDAYNFSQKCNADFDLIIVDLYINDEVPGKFHTKEFVSYLNKMSHKNTLILFNKMLSSKLAKQGYSDLVKEMLDVFQDINLLTYEVNNTTNKIICVNSTGYLEKTYQTTGSKENLSLFALD